MKVGVDSKDKMFLPKGFDLIEMFEGDNFNFLPIDKYGFISHAGSIRFKDKFKEEYDIAIEVGSGYVKIKKK